MFLFLRPLSATHRLTLEIEDVPEASAANARWTVRLEGEADFEISGDFGFDEDDSPSEDQVKMGNLIADVAVFCGEGEAPTTECIPCSLVAGCQLIIELDLCGSSLEEETSVAVAIEPEGGEYTVYCPRDTDWTPCENLDDWLTAEAAQLQSDLCSEDE